MVPKKGVKVENTRCVQKILAFLDLWSFGAHLKKESDFCTSQSNSRVNTNGCTSNIVM